MSLILNIYIQQSFWEHFAHFYDANNDYWLDFKQWVDKFLPKFRLFLECEQNVFFQLVNENPFLKTLHNSINISGLYFLPNLSTEIHNLPFYQNESYPFRFFFTHENIETCTSLAQRFGFMYFTLSELAIQWETFYSLRPDAKMVVTKSPNQPNKFDNWAKLQEFKHPLNHILIFDNYLFGDKTVKQNGVDVLCELQDNLYPILDNLLTNNIIETQIDLILFGKNKNIKRHNSPNSYHQFRPQIERVREDIFLYLSENYPHLNIKVLIVEYSEKKHGDYYTNVSYFDTIHDRYLITNYFCIESSGGFDLFDRNNGIIKTAKITFDFHFHSLNTEYISFVLKNIKSYIEIPDIVYYPNNNLIQHPFLS